MKRLMICAILLCAATGRTAGKQSETFEFGRLGLIRLFATAATHPVHVVILLSGSDGWTPPLSEMATRVSALDALVIGVDTQHYLKQLDASREKCVYPAADLEALSKFAQMKLGSAGYEIPVLAGYAAGGPLAYAVLAESPHDIFRGAVSIGFCPTVALTKPLCRGSNLETAWTAKTGQRLLPAKALPAPWILLHTAAEAGCASVVAEDFAKHVQGARMIRAEAGASGGGEADLRNALTSLFGHSQDIRHPPPEAVRDLPVVEVPAAGPGLCESVVQSALPHRAEKEDRANCY